MVNKVSVRCFKKYWVGYISQFKSEKNLFFFMAERNLVLKTPFQMVKFTWWYVFFVTDMTARDTVPSMAYTRCMKHT